MAYNLQYNNITYSNITYAIAKRSAVHEVASI